MSISSYKLIELAEAQTDESGKKKSLVITKTAKFLRGFIIEHNMRVSSGGFVTGRLIMKIEGKDKEIEAGDIASIEATT